MRLIEKKIVVDPNTYQPLMQLTIQVPLEIMADGIALMGETEVKQVLGTELLNHLKDQKNV